MKCTSVFAGLLRKIMRCTTNGLLEMYETCKFFASVVYFLLKVVNIKFLKIK